MGSSSSKGSKKKSSIAISNKKASKTQKIKLTLNILEKDLKKEINFLGYYYDKDYYRIPFFSLLGEPKISIDGASPTKIKKYTPQKFKNAGTHEVLIEFNNLLSSCNGMFRDCGSISKIEFLEFNTEEVTDMQNMFCGCSNLEILDLSKFITKNVSNMSGMFDNCLKIKEMNLSSFDTEQVKEMKYMFYECCQIEKLDLSSFSTKNLCNMDYMFKGCSKIKELKISKFETKKVNNCWFMFYGCSQLDNIDFPISCDNIKAQFHKK